MPLLGVDLSRLPAHSSFSEEHRSVDRMPLRLHAPEVLNGVHHHGSADRNKQDIARNPDIPITGTRRGELDDDRWRYLVVNDALRKGLSDMPLFRLTRWHAAVVLLGKTRGTFASPELLLVIFMDDYPIAV